MEKQRFISYNRYFLFACIAWWVAGAIWLITTDKFCSFEAINGHYNAFFDFVMPLCTIMGQVQVIVPVLLLLFLNKRFRTRAYFLSALCCNVIPFLIQQGLKSLFDFERPLSFFGLGSEHVHLLPGWQELYHRSFPSGHTAGAFSFFCFLALLLPAKYKWLGLVLFVLAMLVGYSRVYLGAHFVEDVYFGSFAGTLSTLIVFSLLRKFGYEP